MTAVPIRTPETIDSEIWQLRREIEAQDADLESLENLVDSDEFDGGRISQKSARALMRDSDHGRLTNGYHLGHALAGVKRRQSALSRTRDALRQLKQERALWTRMVPVGMQEIAALLGYSAEAPRQWKHRNVLPPAAGSVSGTPYWWRPDVLRWALEHGRTRAILPAEELESWEEAA